MVDLQRRADEGVASLFHGQGAQLTGVFLRKEQGMLQYDIPGYGRLRRRRRKQLLETLARDGWDAESEYSRVAALPLDMSDNLGVEYLDLDLNGTIVSDVLVPGVAEQLAIFQQRGVKLRILTGDVRGTAEQVKVQLASGGVDVELVVCQGECGTAYSKLRRILEAGPDKVAYVGNGQGDCYAVRIADFSIAVTQSELSAAYTLAGAVGHATSVIDALRGMLDEQLMRATFHQ